MPAKGGFKYKITKTKLVNLYLKRKWSKGKIALYFRCSITVVTHRLILYGIQIRPRCRYIRLKLSPEKLAYLAGFVDGDGSITIQQKGLPKKQKKSAKGVKPIFFHPVLVLSNKSPLFPRYTRDVLNMEAKKYPHKGDFQYRLVIEGFRILPILEDIGPYLKLREPQCELVRKYIKSRIRNKGKRYTKDERKKIAFLKILNNKCYGSQSGKNDILLELKYLSPQEVVIAEK